MKFSRMTQTPQPDRADGLSAITFYGSWIVNADTKSGFLSAGLTVLGAAAFAQLSAFLAGTPSAGWRDLFAGVFLAAALVGIGAGAFFLVSALNPRTAPPTTFSRYAFPSLAAQPAGFVPPLDADQQRAEAWTQARSLALIAATKYTFFRRGLYAFFASAPALGVAATLIR
ncbi:hypothetical protein [Phytohabitans houttuyneae]|uniref:Pycsar effector protein domain-containing protein n=1 Tax=Phytohabitans houttuyneae TaxID=1076126 RepID=A0A6V8K5U3_9ACTN|nr:hypothetical protein [Phytohabitans houttuyneae]GFJ77356.1 hypothetical protein Phou_015360 [Phytohabitans houttuyneae]